MVKAEADIKGGVVLKGLVRPISREAAAQGKAVPQNEQGMPEQFQPDRFAEKILLDLGITQAKSHEGRTDAFSPSQADSLFLKVQAQKQNPAGPDSPGPQGHGHS